MGVSFRLMTAENPSSKMLDSLCKLLAEEDADESAEALKEEKKLGVSALDSDGVKSGSDCVEGTANEA